MDTYKVIRKEELPVARWSGGTTTQIAIWPEEASYAERNFSWRVSSARVEDEESEFTSLPGVTRCLMVLEGELFLSHEGYYDVHLERFSQDNFEGGWKSRSRGRVTDFNLMTRDAEGRVQAVEVPCGEEQLLYLAQPAGGWQRVSEVFYATTGSVRAETVEGKRFALNRGDVLIRHCDAAGEAAEMKILNTSAEVAYIIRAVIYHD